MLKFPPLWIAFLVFLGSCALDIAPPVDPGPTAKAPYSVPADGSGSEVRHYDGNDRLISIDRYDLDPDGRQLKKYHYSAQEVLLWYEYRRFEKFSTQWRMTREIRYTPPKDGGILMWRKSRAYDSSGNEILAVDFDAQSAPNVRSYQHTWGEPAGAGFRTLQATGYKAELEPSPFTYELYRYRGTADNKLSGWATLDNDRSVRQAWSYGYDTDSNQTSVIDYQQAQNQWSRETGNFVPGTSTQYRAAWYRGTATAPSAPSFASPQPSSPVLADPGSLPANTTADTFDPDSSNALAPSTAVSTLPAVQYVDFPTLTPPTTWTPLAFEYYLPGPYGTITLRFDKDDFPVSLSKAALGAFDALQLDFVWDLQGRLTRRIASYAQNPVLTVDLHRDDQGRIDRVNTAGSLMRVPLDYVLTYATVGSTRPETLTLASQGSNLLTLSLTYDDDQTTDGAFGLGPLQFDSHVTAVRAGIGGVSDLLDVLGLEFQNPVTVGDETTKTALVYDVLNKPDADKVLKGRLVWTTNTATREVSFQWQTASGDLKNSPTYTTAWSYSKSWGGWADLATNAGNAVDGVVDETVSAMEAKLAQAMSLADSFDFERVLQLVNVVQSQLPAVQAQLERSASSLLEQIKAAAGQ